MRQSCPDSEFRLARSHGPERRPQFHPDLENRPIRRPSATSRSRIAGLHKGRPGARLACPRAVLCRAGTPWTTSPSPGHAGTPVWLDVGFEPTDQLVLGAHGDLGMQGVLYIPEVVRLSGNLVRHQAGSPDCATLRKSLTSECGSNAYLILSFLFYICGSTH